MTLDRGCAQRGLKPQIGVAPTPLAALWLARGADVGRHSAAGRGKARNACSRRWRRCRSPSSKRRRTLPNGSPLSACAGSAICSRCRVPVSRAGSAALLSNRSSRRWASVPTRARTSPSRAQFALRLELPQPVGDASALRFVARRLVEALCGWLAQRQAGVTACTLSFEHGRSLRHAADSQLELRCASATRDPERLMRILRERLERTRLVAPVQAVKLSAEACEALPGRSIDLFDTARAGAADDALARSCRTPACAARRSRRAQPRSRSRTIARNAPRGRYRLWGRRLATVPPQPAPARPLWLFAAPAALAEIGGRPHRHGTALELLAGPEHIAAGWWDAGERSSDPRAPQCSLEALGDVRRDYFIARSAQHECLWIFRDHGGWFLHGVFA